MSKPVQTALVTNVLGYAGAPAVDALLGAGFNVFAHDRSFSDAETWRAFHRDRERLECLWEAEPEVLIESAAAGGALCAIVSNDHVPAPAYSPEAALVDALRANLEGLIEFPFRLVRAALPVFRALGGGNVVMITSNRMRLPLKGGAFPDSARAGANALVRSLAVDCAADGVIVNAVAPNFLYSEAFYPKAFYKETERGRAYVDGSVPVGRLAEPDEIGEVIAFLATAKTRFLTGAVIDFSGGWPFGPARPNG
ncbi:MAG: SDR family oxidoreductase [Pseudomonadota bacterium]